jgi:bifunctional non-homologous end joining protein LigD
MTATKTAPAPLRIPESENATVQAGRHTVELTNLDKVFWPELGLTKRALLHYYADVAHALLPHLKDRAMVMKRYPNGIHGKWFFMK